MLDVYADGPILHEVVKLKKDKLRTEPIYEKIFNFLNCSCNLYVNKLHASDINKMPKYHYLNLFTQGKGDLGKMTPLEFDKAVLNEVKPWSVFLLEQSGQNRAFHDTKYCNADKHNFIEKISELLFQSKGQTTSFIIIPTEKIKDNEEKDANLFYGWQSLDGINLLQLTDVVVVDRFFLAPAYHRTLKDYVQECLLPLFRVFQKRTILENLNITVFSEGNDKIKFSAKKLYDEIVCHPEFNDLSINFSLAVRKERGLGIHKRYIYTNYQGMNPGLSIHSFTYSKILGDQDDFEIFPYALKPEKHENDLNQLKKLANDLKAKRFTECGNVKSNRLLSF